MDTPPQAPKVLLVDADAFSASVYEAKFSGEGFSVLHANGGEEGLKLAEVQVPDLILLDLLLPRINGLEVLRRLRRNPILAKTPVVMLTDLDRAEDVERCLREGARDYLVKAHSMPGDTVRKVKMILGLS